jgi:hypothetical protein
MIGIPVFFSFSSFFGAPWIRNYSSLIDPQQGIHWALGGKKFAYTSSDF